MVWMCVKKTRSAFIDEAVVGGHDQKDAAWWWDRMYSEAMACRNGTAEGSEGGTENGDAVWMALMPITWWPVQEEDIVQHATGPEHHRLEAVGKILAYLCRHGAKKEGYSMDAVGGLLVSDLLWYHEQLRGMEITQNDIQNVVAEVHIHASHRKSRFALYNDQCGYLRVKAHQGHSATVGKNIDDKLVFKEVVCASNIICCHGTYQRHWTSIEHYGLRIQGRKHVHFADHILTLSECDKEILILLDVRKWLGDGGVLFKSNNNVFLTEGFQGTVASSYFHEVRQIRPSEKVLWTSERKMKPNRRW